MVTKNQLCTFLPFAVALTMEQVNIKVSHFEEEGGEEGTYNIEPTLDLLLPSIG